MKTKIFLLLALASLPLQLPTEFAGQGGSKESPAQAQQTATPAAKWERYTYPGEEFSVELPGTPFFVEMRRAVRGARGLTEKTRVYELYGDGVAVLITSFDSPRRNESLENFADMSGLTTWRSRGVVAAVGDVASGGFKGREYNIAGDVYAGRARVFIAKRHAYVLEARSLDPTHPSLARFFESLTLGEHPNGESAVELEYPGEFKTAPPAAGGLDRGPGRGGNLILARPPDARSAPRTPHAAGEPYDSREVTRKAVIVYKMEPGYTEEARRRNVSGTVMVRAVLSSTGKVADITVLKGLPNGLTEKAVYAARQTLFFPAQVDGQDVSQYVLLEYNFSVY